MDAINKRSQRAFVAAGETDVTVAQLNRSHGQPNGLNATCSIANNTFSVASYALKNAPLALRGGVKPSNGLIRAYLFAEEAIEELGFGKLHSTKQVCEIDAYAGQILGLQIELGIFGS